MCVKSCFIMRTRGFMAWTANRSRKPGQFLRIRIAGAGKPIRAPEGCQSKFFGVWM